MKRIYRSSIVLIGLAITLCGCSSINIFKKQHTQYLQAQAEPLLRVPVGLNQAGVGNDYPVPALVNTASVGELDLIPPGSMAEKYARGQVTKDELKQIEKFAKAKNPTIANVPIAAPASAKTDLPQGITLAGDVPVLPLNQNSSQAWDIVGKGLKRAGYRIAYQNEKVRSYYILDIFATNGKITKTTPIYQVKLENSSAGNGYAYVLDQMGSAVKSDVAETILEKLKDGIAGKGPSFFSEAFAPIKRWFSEAF